MPLFFGQNKIKKVFFGERKIKSIYIGANKVWSGVSFPAFTGSYVLYGTPEKGYMELKTSGTLTISDSRVYDLCLVGGGASGGNGYKERDQYDTERGGTGGGGGYVNNTFSVPLNGAYIVEIGAGGERPPNTSSAKQVPGNPTKIKQNEAVLFQALGGRQKLQNGQIITDTVLNAGGSYGGKGGYVDNEGDGNSGTAGSSNGKETGISTYAFAFEPDAPNVTDWPLYSGGGGGGGRNNGSAGGAGGGGHGGGENYRNPPTPGTPNTGGGGGGSCTGNATSSHPEERGEAGGSGVVLIRWGFERNENKGNLNEVIA